MDKQPTNYCLSYTCFLQLVSLILISMPYAHAMENIAFILPPEHESTYKLEKFNTVVGELKNTLTYKKGIISYTSVATAKGIAALLISTDPKESNILSWPKNAHNTIPSTISYRYFFENGHKKNQQMDFSRDAKGNTHIKGSYKFKSYELDSKETLWNRQFLPILMSNYLSRNPHHKEKSIYITNKGDIYKLTYTFQARETLRFKGKDWPVLKFKITQKGKRRATFAWLSKKHFYLPLKIEQYKKGDLNARLIMTQLKLTDND